MGDLTTPQWRRLQHTVLCQRTDRLVGPPANPTEESAMRFTVTQFPLPDGRIAVTMDDTCNLADVYDLCARVAHACLSDDDRVTFSRAVADQHGDLGSKPTSESWLPTRQASRSD